MRRIKLVISYHGKDYAGWQVQKNRKTVQGTIQDILSDFLKEPINLSGSGRTDSGVHALGQVAHFDMDNDKITGDCFRGILNYRLPESITILESSEVAPDFHARKSVIKKTYRYQIYHNHKVISPLYQDRFAHIRKALDLDLMIQGAQDLVGTHDFKAFAAAQNSTETTVRTIYNLTFLPEEDDQIIFEVTGNGFLMRMVRNIAGTLIEIGLGKRPVDSIPEIIKSRDRKNAGVTAPASGLLLKRVYYGSIR